MTNTLFTDLSTDTVEDRMSRAMEAARHILDHQEYYWDGPEDAVLKTFDSTVPLLDKYKTQSPYARMALEFIQLYRLHIEKQRQNRAAVASKRAEIAKNYDEFFLVIGRRDGFYCKGCGLSPKSLQIDHILPVIRGGTNDLDNLQLLCAGCNASKSDKV